MTIDDWHSITTLVVFLLTNAIVVFPFHVTLRVPAWPLRQSRRILERHRIVHCAQDADQGVHRKRKSLFSEFRLPVNFVVAPLVAVLFLLATRSIGKNEVKHGIIGSDNIHPIDIMAFFLALAYMAISLDSTGLIGFLALLVLRKCGEMGRRLYLLLYIFFFGLGTLIGNDPIILSGTPFLAYFTHLAANIDNPKAWIFAQFCVANISSAILVSSNPTNLVLAGAFKIKFITYTANMIVPVLITALALFPCLLFLVFRGKGLIPHHIRIHDPQSSESKNEQARTARSSSQEALPPYTEISQPDKEKTSGGSVTREGLSLEELLNPSLETSRAVFGSVLIAITLVVLLVTNATGVAPGVYAITVPAAFVMLCRDVFHDLRRAPETETASRDGSVNETKVQYPPSAHRTKDNASLKPVLAPETGLPSSNDSFDRTNVQCSPAHTLGHNASLDEPVLSSKNGPPSIDESFDETTVQRPPPSHCKGNEPSQHEPILAPPADHFTMNGDTQYRIFESPCHSVHHGSLQTLPSRRSPLALDEDRALSDVLGDRRRYVCKKFPTVSKVLQHLPFPMLPFAFCMFILVEGLVSKGWVEVFAKWWSAWERMTGVVGAIAMMGFVSVCLCNFAGTNIGATILLSRVLQVWLEQHSPSDRMKSAAIYSLALGVNYGAFSATFSASLAGLLWRDILRRKDIRVRARDFATVNLPIIAIAMTVGCAVLVAEVCIVKSGEVKSS